MRFTVDQAKVFMPADDPTLPGDGYASPRFYRHLYFIHFVLGEPWGDSFRMAHAFRDAPLSLKRMKIIANGWDDEPVVVDGTATEGPP
jgi:hypothetical protein